MGAKPAVAPSSSYWEKYRYKESGILVPHNPHHAGAVRPEVRALLNLLGVRLAGCAQGNMMVTQDFRVTNQRPRHSFVITAANDGPIDAPIETWQEICKTLLDYAMQNGYEEPTNHEQETRS